MNYEDMTYFEINKAVAEIAFNGCTSHKDSSSGLCMVNLNKPMEDDIYFNPCNNPSDAWPIILENKINLLWDTESTEWEAQAIVTTDMYFPSTCEHFYYDENPLRAAMIVYLMMNEGK